MLHALFILIRAQTKEAPSERSAGSTEQRNEAAARGSPVNGSPH